MINSILIYLTTFSISLLFLKVSENYEKQNNKNKLISILYKLLIIMPPVLLAGFRYYVGIDYGAYVDIYRVVESRLENDIVKIFNMYEEPSAIIICIVSKILFNAPFGFFIISSLIMMAFIVRAINNEKGMKSKVFILFIFYMVFYQISFNIVRQMIAVAVILYAYKYAMTKDFKKYLIWVIVAMLFHKTAIICLPFYFLCPKKEAKNEKNKNILFVALIILTPIICKLFIQLLTFVLNLLHIYTGYIGIGGEKSVLFLLYVIPELIIIILLYKDLLKKDYKNIFYIRLFLLQIPLQYFATSIKYADRLSLYTSISQIILMPKLIENIENKKKKRLFKIATILWYIFYYFVMFVYLNSNKTFPYRSIFNI